MTLPKGERLDLPPCTRCGSRLVIKYGAGRFLCKSCGSQFGVPKEVDYRYIPDGDIRPKCPRCGYSKPWKSGTRWTCKMCGRYFNEPLEEF